MITSDEYAKDGGQSCPACGSGDIAATRPEADGPAASSEVECEECGATWRDAYELTGYYDLVTPAIDAFTAED